MLRRGFVMAAAPNSRGRAPRADNVPFSKGGRGRNHMSTAPSNSKPPSGIIPSSSRSERSLVSSVSRLSLQDSEKSSASSIAGHVTRRPYSSNRRPVTIKNVEDVATLLREELVKNVVVVAGAGISTPSGIPDFRSPGTGLYDNLQQYSIPYAEAIFDIDYFHHNPRPFFTLAKELYPTGKYRPNYLHYFAKLLFDRGLLLRMYTQNIDGLERISGIPAEKLVEAHGTFSSATCVTCGLRHDKEEIKDKIFQDKFPRCKRTTCNGIVKPDIVFFGEQLPKRFYLYLKDMLQADLVLIMGTSLEVQPFAGIIDTVRFTVPRLLFNRTAVGPFKKQKRHKDFVAAGDLLEQVQEFAAMVGWTQDMVDLITRKEGYFKTAFPPPVPTNNGGGDKKVVKPAKPDPLAAMWRQNAQANFYSDTDSSESDSGVTPSDTDDTSTDSERGQGRNRTVDRGRGKAAKVASTGPRIAGKSSSSSTVSSSSSGCVSNASSGSATDRRMDKSGPLLGRRGGVNGNGGQRSFHQPANRIDANLSTKGALPNFQGNSRRTAWTVKEGSKPPTGPTNQRKPPVMPSRGARQFRQTPTPQGSPAPGTHAVKPRSNSLTKAVPEKVHTKTTDDLKSLVPRVRSAQPAKLNCRHMSMRQRLYNARMLPISADLSDSSSSDDNVDGDDSDDTSDDSR
ncbi:uncharacterized protein [Littorina saxatilis]|uniref:Deacetylase sirtuin-type domain-containing protein n=1 Tax=Littorina saxatilis TaxID=31220 RepID=A0AAN9G9I8_9CAEN